MPALRRGHGKNPEVQLKWIEFQLKRSENETLGLKRNDQNPKRMMCFCTAYHAIWDLFLHVPSKFGNRRNTELNPAATCAVRP